MEFRVLGTVEATVGGRDIDLGRRLERCLLGLLLLELGSPTSSDQLIELLWDGDAPSRSRGALQVQVSRLRKRLTTAAAEEYGFRLVTRGTSYLLEGDPERVDAHRFRSLYERARTTEALPERAELLREALGLWRGPALDDVASDRIRERVSPRLDELFLSATDLRLSTELEQGRHHEALAELAELTGRYPLRERLAELHILALYRAGRRADALDAFQRIRASLAEELGLDPGRELYDLQTAVLRADPALDAPVQRPRAPRAVAPSAAPPAQLPPDVADFTGRQDQLELLDGLLPDHGRPGPAAVMITTIAGVGGVGKTALAVHWAHRVRDRYPDGQLYVNLHGYSSTAPLKPMDALARLLRALGVADAQIPTDPEEATGQYRTLLADRRILIVLDNANHPDQVRPLLPGSPGSLALVTSRDRLAGLVARDGARRVTLDALHPAESLALLARIVGAHRIEAEPEAAAELAGLCGHLPLALRITAALLADRPTVTLAAHTAELRADRLEGLAVDGDEQSSVRAAFDQSYRSLRAEVARAFRLLGLFPGPDFTADVLAALTGAGPDGAETLLGRLAEAHLVEPLPSGRHALHDLVQLYARELAGIVDPGAERLAARGRLFDWYLNATDVAVRLLYPTAPRLAPPAPGPAPIAFEDGEEAVAWLDAERPSLVAVTVDGEDRPDEPTWLLTDALRNYLHYRRLPGDRFTVGRAGLAAAVAAGDDAALAACHLSLGQAYTEAGDHGSAVAHHDEGLALARAAGWQHGVLALLTNLGIAHRYAGQLDLAAAAYAQVLEVQQAGGGSASPGSLVNLGTLYLQLGRPADALDPLRQALTVFTGQDVRNGVAVAHTNLGHAFHLLGRFAEAQAHLELALPVHREFATLNGEADTLYCLGSIDLDAGRTARAAERARAALTVARDGEIRSLEIDARNLLGAAHLAAGRVADAVEEHGAALRGSVENGYRVGTADAHMGLAAAELRLGHPAEAAEHAWQAVAGAADAGFRLHEGRARTLLAASFLASGDRARAAEFAAEAAAIGGERGYRLGEANALDVLGRAADPAHLRRALQIRAEIGAPNP